MFHDEYPDLVEQAVDISSWTTRSQKTRIEWKCDLGHTWEASPFARVYRKNGCPYCAGQKALPGESDISATHPELYDQLVDKTLVLRPGSHKKVEWECTSGHRWESVVKSRTMLGRGCPVCSGRIAVHEVDDLSVDRPGMYEMLKDKSISLRPYSHQKVTWVCGHGHEWDTEPYHIAEGKGCPVCSVGFRRSRDEIEVFEYVKNLLPGSEVVANTKEEIGMELDIYIPSKSLAIDFNGLWWHRESLVGKNYHQDKHRRCQEVGIQLIQIWEDEWKYRKEVVKRKIESVILGRKQVGARKISLDLVDFHTANTFLNENHVQGGIKGTSYVGLFLEENLVGVCVFRLEGEVTYLTRYASTVGVIGGLNKCVKFNGPGKYVSFSDNCLSDGSMYAKNGWSAQETLPADYKYVRRGVREHKFKYRIKKFKNDKSLNYVEGLSERELAELNGMYRVWDAGKIRWTIEV